MKRLLFVLLVFSIAFSPHASAFAQSASPFFKDRATTIVGSAEPNPSTNPNPSIRPPSQSDVPSWAATFASNLEITNGETYTHLRQAITNPATSVTISAGNYVCTGLVRSAFRLAGETAPQNSLASLMQHNWKSINGGELINYTQDNRLLNRVQPGDAFFQMYRGNFIDGFAEHNHVSIVYSINVDANGDGTIVTREANAPKTSYTVRFQNWQMRSYPSGYFDVFLFGLRK